jgi:hypothetical protein
MNFLRLKRSVVLALVAYVSASAVQSRAQYGEGVLRANAFYASSYVYRGVERANASAQATVEYERDEFRAAVWTNQPFDRSETRELNLSAAYRWSMTDALDLEVIATHAWFDHAPGGGVNRSAELAVNATLSRLAVWEFVPTVSYARDFRFEADIAQLAWARSVALTKLGAFLEFNLFAGWADGGNWRPDGGGAKREDAYGYWGGEVRLPYHIGRYALVTGLHYTNTKGRSAWNGPFSVRSGASFWASIGLSYDL